MPAITDDPLHVSLRLLDRRVVDVDGEPVGRVDDLAFEQDADDAPRLVSILMGPEALGARLGGVLGRVVAGAGRLRPDAAGPPEVAVTDLEEVDTEVRLAAHRDDLPFPRSEAWVRDHVIGRIPGAERSSSGGKEPGGEAGVRQPPGTGRGGEVGRGPADGGARRLRASDLLGTPVVERSGRRLGRLRDLRLRADGDVHRIDGLVTGRGVVAERLGYAYGEVVGPALLVALMRRAERRTSHIDWEDLVELTADRIVVRDGAAARPGEGAT
ncbi:MAG: PRC-barrel domain-containing protein [Actinobacteria bacterium]|nr:PRC-barrel domain-containing protein [Actinomycetota bacterium]